MSEIKGIEHKFRVWVDHEDDDWEGDMVYLEPTVGRYDYEWGTCLPSLYEAIPSLDVMSVMSPERS